MALCTMRLSARKEDLPCSLAAQAVLLISQVKRKDLIFQTKIRPDGQRR
jgi:hypothetical protein